MSGGRTPRATIVGGAGRGTTARMLETIAGAVAAAEHPPVVVLRSLGEALNGAGASRSWSEVLSSTPAGATIVIPSRDTRLREAARLAGAPIVSFGFDPSADIRGSELVATSAGTSFVLHRDGEELEVALPMLGEHLAEDALAALAWAAVAGIAAVDAIGALTRMRDAGDGVMQALRRNDLLVIDDSAGMSAVSTAAALKALAMFGTEGRRTVAVLGELDLGAELPAEAHREAHDRIGRLVVRLNIASLIVIGDNARHVHNAAGLEGSWNGESVLVQSESEAYHRVREHLGPDDVVLVKFGATSGAPARFARRLSEEAVAG